MRFYSSMPCCKYCKYFLYVAIFTSLLYPIIVSSSSTQTAQIESSNIIANPLSDSSQKFILEKSLKEKDIRQYLYYYIDETSKLDIEIISSDKFSSHFKPIGEKASFGYSRCSFWFRLTVKNPTAEPIKWFFEYPYAAVDHFIFYKPVSVVTDINSSSDINIFNPESTSNERDALTNRFTVIRSGDKYPFSERPVNFRTTVIPMNQTSGESTFYFNIVSDGAIVVPLVARSEQQMQTYMNADAVTNWMYYGVMIAAILYNFFIFVSIRELEYLYLILFIAGVSLLIMTQNGLSFQYLWYNNIWWANVCNPLFGTLSFLGLIPFTTLFLSTKKEFPRVHRLMTLLIYIGIVLLILIFIVPYHIATQCMVIFVGISSAIILVITTILSFRGQRQALFYIIACSSMLIVTLLLVLKLFGFIESNLWAYAGVYQIAISLLVTILSFGLVDKINIIKKDKAIALEEKQNALDMVKASEKQYRLLADNVKEVIWTLDLKTWKMNYITPSILNITGYSVQEAKQQFSFKQMLSPDSAKKAIDIIKLYSNADNIDILEDSPPIELEFYKKNRDTIWTETNITFLRDELNQPFEMIGVSRDITERKRSEREKRRLEDQLTQSNKLEAIGTLAGGISHDMNNILTAIMGYVEISLSDVPSDSKIHQRLERVLNACYRARDLVKQILTFSRQDSHENIPVNINIMVKEVLKLIRASLPATIKIEQNIPKDRSIIMADPTKIHQIIMNLCSNAGYAMQENGGLLNVSTEVMEIDSDSAGRYLQLAGGRYIRMTVSDTGHGMDKEVLNRIFEPFFTTKPQGKGTGMGLAMVHGIVKNLGGNIYVYSEVGQGTTFHLFFPCAPDGVDIQNLETPKLETGTETILYIDDEPPIVDMAYEMLTTLGYKVEGVVGSVEGLERFKQQPEKFDIVITDQTMPELTGCELAKKIWEIRPGLPIILCSGFNDLINPDSAKKLGISEYIMKPYSKHEISVKIRRALK